MAAVPASRPMGMLSLVWGMVLVADAAGVGVGVPPQVPLAMPSAMSGC